MTVHARERLIAAGIRGVDEVSFHTPTDYHAAFVALHPSPRHSLGLSVRLSLYFIANNKK